MVHGKEGKRELNHFQFIIPAEIASTAHPTKVDYQKPVYYGTFSVSEYLR